MLTSLRRLRIEIEQTTACIEWADSQTPPDGGRQLISDLLEATGRDFQLANRRNETLREADSGPANEEKERYV